MKLCELREFKAFGNKQRTRRAWRMANYLASIIQQKIGPQKHGIKRAELVPIVCGIFYRVKVGIPWRALPSIFGAWSTVHGWFMRCVRLNIFSDTFDAMVKKMLKDKRIPSHDLLIDGSLVLHPSRSCLAKNNPRNHNKKSLNRMMLTNRQSMPLVLLVVGGTDHDSPWYLPLLDKLKALGFEKKFVAHTDKGFDSLANRLGTTARGGFPSIPVRKQGYAQDVPVPKTKNKRRIKVEHGFAAINAFRACQIVRECSAETAQATLNIAGLCILSYFAKFEMLQCA